VEGADGDRAEIEQRLGAGLEGPPSGRPLVFVELCKMPCSLCLVIDPAPHPWKSRNPARIHCVEVLMLGHVLRRRQAAV